MNRPPLRRALLALLAVALLTVQWTGLRHRIEHGGATGWLDLAGDAAVAPLGDDATVDPDLSVRHDCSALDALALGSGPPPAAAASALLPAPTTAIGAAAAAPRQPLGAASFDARAPPALRS